MLQKSRKITVLMLTILIIYSIIANYSLVSYGFTYYFIVNPLFWIVFMMIVKIFTCKQAEGTRLKKNIFEYTLIASFIYIGIYIFSQVFITVGKNPYATSIKGILINLYIYVLPIIAKEYTRFKLINNVYEKEKKYVVVLVTAVYIFNDIGLLDVSDYHAITKMILSKMVPIIAENILCTYVALNQMYKPSILYRGVKTAYWFISPILPKVPWIMTAMIDSVIPIILYVYIRYLKERKDRQKNKQQVKENNPKKIIPSTCLIIILLLFGIGIFPLRPVAVATGSMEKTLMVGDIAILSKCNAKDVEVGDIIQYQKNNITVIHRVIAKYYDKEKCFFITKGDNNKAADFEPVSESQLLGKEVFSIKYLGYPAVLINRLTTSSDKITVETGNN